MACPCLMPALSRQPRPSVWPSWDGVCVEHYAKNYQGVAQGKGPAKKVKWRRLRT